MYSTVRNPCDELHIETRFDDGQKFVIAAIPTEFNGFAQWLSNEISTNKELQSIINKDLES